MTNKQTSPKKSTKSLIKNNTKTKPKQTAPKVASSRRKKVATGGLAGLLRARWTPIMVFALLFGGLGMYYLQSTHAATACTAGVFRYKDKDTVNSSNTTGRCVTYAQTLLKQRGYLSGTVDGSYGVITTNAVINFQRAQALTDDGVLGPKTWSRLITPATVSTKIDSRCLTGGVVFCASQAQRKLYFMKYGVVVRTVDARFGGMAWDGKMNGGAGGYRVHRTAKGTFYVYARVDSPISKTYGEDQMPLSLMFDPNMYIHYSADFAARGYAGASHGCINVRDKTALTAMYNDKDVKSAVKLFANNTPQSTIFQAANRSIVRVVVY